MSIPTTPYERNTACTAAVPHDKSCGNGLDDLTLEDIVDGGIPTLYDKVETPVEGTETN